MFRYHRLHALYSWLTHLTHNTLTHWLPHNCFLCGATAEQALCGACLHDLNWQEQGCIRCAAQLTGISTAPVCGQCLTHPPPFQRLYTVFDYDYPLNNLIKAAKYQTNLAILQLLGELMANHLNPDCLPDGIIAVPMHPVDLRRRGYNQALELARIIAKRMQRPVQSNACQCTRRKQPQARLSYQDRLHNVRGLFQVQSLPTTWQHIAIVDDVVTTGATVSELSQTLLQAGVQQVDVWCCARRQDLR